MSVSKIKKKMDEKQRNDVSDIFTSEDMENISLVSTEDVVSFGKYELSIFQ